MNKGPILWVHNECKKGVHDACTKYLSYGYMMGLSDGYRKYEYYGYMMHVEMTNPIGYTMYVQMTRQIGT